MFKYAKRLQYPINIKKKDINMAKQLITQYGGIYYKKDIKK
ncbi:MAG TPA: manganese catalase family protein [Candidatus Onthousia faecipullorum]|uniref:Manganese catalase family protein n=1 Tax=Candidatus Onthousia faecipullorum TaxID=2840887 RepID=A0A9D1GC88_9FIRM|nr:manganese catalase family protein [Candidatus Onthousia faecipullorum]